MAHLARHNGMPTGGSGRAGCGYRTLRAPIAREEGRHRPGARRARWRGSLIVSGVRRPWLLGLLLALVTVGIVVALVDSEVSGTGAENVGESGPERVTTTAPPADDRADRPTAGA